MARSYPVPESDQRIITEERYGHWSAWFADRPAEAFGGDSPGTAVDRLWGAWIANAEAVASREHD